MQVRPAGTSTSSRPRLAAYRRPPTDRRQQSGPRPQHPVPPGRMCRLHENGDRHEDCRRAPSALACSPSFESRRNRASGRRLHAHTDRGKEGQQEFGARHKWAEHHEYPHGPRLKPSDYPKLRQANAFPSHSPWGAAQPAVTPRYSAQQPAEVVPVVFTAPSPQLSVILSGVAEALVAIQGVRSSTRTSSRATC